MKFPNIIEDGDNNDKDGDATKVTWIINERTTKDATNVMKRMF